MSAEMPTPSSSSPAGSSPAVGVAAPSSRPSKPQRVLACVLCQRRKVKCDRQFPCANCVRSRVQCVPATLPRRRKRRFAERELLDHLHKCEDLLRRNNIQFDPLHPEDPAAAKPSAAKAETVSDSDDDQPHMEPEAASSPSTSTQSGTNVGTKNMWSAIRRAYQFLNDDDDGEESLDNHPAHSHIRRGWDRAYESDEHLLFNSNNPPVDMSTFHPDPVQIFKLWQIYLDNVNPLLKVTHAPTLQGRIIDAAGNLKGINPNLEALMFAIYSMAVLSLVPGECEAKTGESKDVLLTKYQFGCKQALLNAEFLRTSDRDCLTALYLYLVSVRPKTDPRSMAAMMGIVHRIAQRMGIHNEVNYEKQSIFEAEMCRRLWWSLMLFDLRMCEFVDYRTSMLIPTWDCRIPLNLDDAELRPEMKELPVIQEKPSDSHFAVVRSAIGDHIRHTSFHLDFVNPALKAVASNKVHSGPDPPEYELAALEKIIEEKYLKPCNLENPTHLMTLWTARGYLAKYRLIEHYSKFLDGATRPTDAKREELNHLALRMVECDTNILTSPYTRGFHWFSHTYFPFPAHVHLIQDIKKRPGSPFSERAWQAISNNFSARPDVPGGKDGPFFNMFATMLLRAWHTCEEAYNQRGQPYTVPEIVVELREKVAQEHNQAEENLDNTMGSMNIDSNIDSNNNNNNNDNNTQSPYPIELAFLNRVMTEGSYQGFMPMGYPTMPQAPPIGFGMQMPWAAMDWSTMGSPN